MFESASLHTARWVESDDNALLQRFLSENESYVADDHTGAPVFLARNAWHLETTEKDFPGIRFLRTREYH